MIFRFKLAMSQVLGRCQERGKRKFPASPRVLHQMEMEKAFVL
jgi:hypothetical protein